MYLRMFYKVNNVYDGGSSSCKQGKGLHLSVYAFNNESVRGNA